MSNFLLNVFRVFMFLNAAFEAYDKILFDFVYIHHRLISRDRPTKTGRLCMCSPFFYVAALNVHI